MLNAGGIVEADCLRLEEGRGSSVPRQTEICGRDRQ